jgi:flagellar export protein FliJ
MKRFRWSLQRLLDVTVQRERALRAELVALSGRISRLREEILRRRAVLRTLLEELGRQDIERRIRNQEVFMTFSAAEERRIRRLNENLKELESQRAQKTAQLLKTRTSRKTLERLREEAYQRYVKEARRIEQKQLDESGNVAFARRLLAARAGAAR